MSKQNRKRKHIQKVDVEYEIETPKLKFRPFDEQAEAEEAQLSQVLFGGASQFLQNLEEIENEPAGGNRDSGLGEEDTSDSDNNDRQAAWTDEDDGIDVGDALARQHRKLPAGGLHETSNKYVDVLKHKFVSVIGKPKWAELNRNKVKEEEDEILQTCGFLTSRHDGVLPSGKIDFKKVNDLNCQTYNEGPIVNCVEFHPTSTVALVAGNGGVASLYAVDGKSNNKLHSVAFERYEILCAKFIQNGNEAILGSRHSHIFSYDLLAAKHIRLALPTGLTQMKNFIVSPDQKYLVVAGKWGEVHVLTANSKERVAMLKQASDVTALAFDPSNNFLFGHSNSGEVTVWDMKTRRVSHKFTDEGCLQGSTLAVSSSNQFIATGSSQGVVNLYGMEDIWKSSFPKPRRAIFNLTTAITDLKFNETSEILALSSIHVKNSIKLFHVPSASVFSNFPTFDSKLGHVSVLNFSPGSGYLAFGNKKSTVLLYRLKYYKNY